ncbi:MAG TPA: hypothetical protein PLX05_12285 [Acinetobacter parvus]|uniref:hypothetical protein n=1 Tax=Acinetobacter parvus TaxID=134533 RepID=UPI002BE7627F|nr:hypothetical protein [Acinetobacter parvus]HRM16353.1 hypothetical protein [Acinetobacter parvus]
MQIALIIIFTLSIIAFIAIKIARLKFYNQNLKQLVERCNFLFDRYVDELNEVRRNKRNNIIRKIMTPTIVKALSTDHSLEAISEDVIDDNILGLKVIKGIKEYYTDDYLKYLQGVTNLFGQVDIEISYKRGDTFSYFGLIIAGALVYVNSWYAIFFMIAVITRSVLKLSKLKSMVLYNENGRNNFVIENEKYKLVLCPLEDHHILLMYDNKIMGNGFAEVSLFPFE